MSQTIVFNSAKLNGALTTDMTMTFGEAVRLGDFNWEVAMIKANLWYFHFNVTSRSFVYERDDGSATDYTINFPDGIYSVGDLNTYIRTEMKANGHSGTDAAGNDVFYISLAGNRSTGKVYLAIDNPSGVTYKAKLGEAGNIANLIGFAEATVSTSAYGANVADINNGVDAWQIRCDLVNGSYDNGAASEILHQFVPRSAPGSNIEIEPINPVYLQVNKATITRIRLYVTDQNGNILDLHGEDVVVMLHLRSMK